MITHDLGVIASMCSPHSRHVRRLRDSSGTTREIFYSPKHPYMGSVALHTQGADGRNPFKLLPIPGTPPDMLRPPKECPFAPALPVRDLGMPQYMAPETVLSDTHRVSCHPDDAQNAPKVTREEV